VSSELHQFVSAEFSVFVGIELERMFHELFGIGASMVWPTMSGVAMSWTIMLGPAPFRSLVLLGWLGWWTTFGWLRH
jgi:hypothetical protein